MAGSQRGGRGGWGLSEAAAVVWECQGPGGCLRGGQEGARYAAEIPTKQVLISYGVNEWTHTRPLLRPSATPPIRMNFLPLSRFKAKTRKALPHTNSGRGADVVRELSRASPIGL